MLLLAGLTSCGVADEAADSGEGMTTTQQGEGGSGDTGSTCADPCEGGVVIAEGYIRCEDGRINRIGGGEYLPEVNAPGCQGDEDDLQCTADADCGGAPNKCISDVEFWAGTTLCRCALPCASDEDCGSASVCVPPPLSPVDWPTCVAASCTTSDDCGACGECGVHLATPTLCEGASLECRTPNDSCANDEDCELGDYCAPGWQCNGCDIGRPLVVEDGARLAPVERGRQDWHALGFEGLEPDPPLAEHWAEAAAYEHASVASFARFGLQLMALGAPPRLLRACKRAALDEIEHARLAYGLASAYGRVALGPGRLSLDGVEIDARWRTVVAGLIEEACVSETLGVAEAMTAADAAREAEVRAVLRRIVDDELRHAQLAWQSLDWLLARAPLEDRAWALELLDRAIAAAARARFDHAGLERPDAGVLGPAHRASLHRQTSREVLAPLARALAARLS